MTVVIVEGRKEEYSSSDYSRAMKPRVLQHVLVCPSNNDLAKAIENNVIGNNAFTRREIKNAENILGPSY